MKEGLEYVGGSSGNNLYFYQLQDDSSPNNTTAKLHHKFPDLTFRAKLTMQLQGIIDDGRPFYQVTYILEGNDPLIFTTRMVLIGLDSVINNDIDAMKFGCCIRKSPGYDGNRTEAVNWCSYLHWQESCHK